MAAGLGVGQGNGGLLGNPPEGRGEDYSLRAQVSLGQGDSGHLPLSFPVLLNLKGSRTPVVSLRN